MEALIVIFVTGLISMFIAMARKPFFVLITALLGLITAGTLFIYRWFNIFNENYKGLELKYEGLQFDMFSISYSTIAILFSLMIILVGYQKFKEEIANPDVLFRFRNHVNSNLCYGRK